MGLSLSGARANCINCNRDDDDRIPSRKGIFSRRQERIGKGSTTVEKRHQRLEIVQRLIDDLDGNFWETVT